MNKKNVFLAVFSLLLYSNTLFNGFISDDYALLNDRALTPGSAAEFFSPSWWEGVPKGARGRFRPLRTLSLLADRGLYGEAPRGYHLTNALLNTAAVLAAANLGGLLFKSAEIGFAGGLFFAAYPAHTEAVDWVKNRSDILCSLFYFLALIFFLKFLSGGRAAAALASCGFCFLSLLSKETAATLPLAGFAASLFLYREGERKRGFLLAGALLLGVCLWFFSKELWWNRELSAQAGLDAYTQLRMVLYTLGQYLQTLFFPFRLSAERAFDPLKAGAILLNPAFAVFAGLTAWAWYRKDREMGFSLAWAPITLLPVLNVVFLESRPIAEQRLYLPAAGFAWLLALAYGRLKERKYAVPLFAALLLVFSAAAFSRNFVWKDDLAFWSDAVAKNPSNFRANYNLAVEYQRLGRFGDAVARYSAAAKDADLPEIYYGLAFCYDKVGEYGKSLENYGMALKLAQRPVPDLYNNMAIVCEKAGDVKRAAALYRQALAADPDYVPARKNLERLGEKWKKK